MAHKQEQIRKRTDVQAQRQTPRGHREETSFPVHPAGTTDLDPREGKVVDQTGWTDWEGTWGSATWGP